MKKVKVINTILQTKEMGFLARGSNKSSWVLFLMILSGIVIGGFLGALLGKYVPALDFGYKMGVNPHTWDFNIIKLTFGLYFNINMFSVLGIIGAIYFYRKL